MTKQRRELMFKVMDGQESVLPILHFLNQFERCDDMLNWALRNRLTGRDLAQFLTVQFGNSLLTFAKFVLMKLSHDLQMQPVIVGRDFVSSF